MYRTHKIIKSSEVKLMNDKKQIMVGKGIKFERIRRITGYLTGTIDRWNNAKNAEQKDRVKHSLV